MTITNGGQISMYDINNEFRYPYYQVGIYEARNGYYGGVRDASGRNPNISNRNGGAYYNGYALSDWYGFDNGANYCNIYGYLRESWTDTDMRIRTWNAYGAYIQESWFWSTNNYDQYAFSTRAWDQLDVYFDNYISWGSYWDYAEKYVYSYIRGYVFYVYEPVGYYEFYSMGYLYSGETVLCRFIN
jgi:hypothetical protein